MGNAPGLNNQIQVFTEPAPDFPLERNWQVKKDTSYYAVTDTPDEEHNGEQSVRVDVPFFPDVQATYSAEYGGDPEGVQTRVFDGVCHCVALQCPNLRRNPKYGIINDEHTCAAFEAAVNGDLDQNMVEQASPHCMVRNVLKGDNSLSKALRAQYAITSMDYLYANKKIRELFQISLSDVARLKNS